MNIIWRTIPLASVLCGLMLPVWSAQEPGQSSQPSSQALPGAAEPSAPVIAVSESMARAWPLRILIQDASLQVHRPEFERWDGARVEGRMAVVVEKPGAARDYYGSVAYSARALPKVDGVTTVLDEFVLRDLSFPTLTAETESFAAALRHTLAGRAFLMDTKRLHDEIRAGQMQAGATRSTAAPDPIAILYRDHSALLVPVDGEPVLREVPSTGFLRVINSRALILLQSGTGRYYLWAQGTWWQAEALSAPWRTTRDAPQGLDALRDEMVVNEHIDALTGEKMVPGEAPEILVSTVPTELLKSEGPARYSPIAETQLLYVTNSPNRLFMELRTKTHYALISGRWYRNSKLASEGWEYVPPDQVSAEFRRIPPDHPVADVLAAIPGTPAAREAVLANRVPRMATVSRTRAQLEVNFDGEGIVLETIAGTSLERVVNAPIPIIRVPGGGSAGTYYALDGAVWYVADMAQGPWKVATWIPPEIYAIPADSPLHYVTYARVYDVQDDVVYTGYTPGYTGSYVTTQNVVVYGPARCYQPWIGWYWYASPCGYGYGFGAYFSWYDTWAYRGGYRAHYGHHHHHTYWPWWGAWHPREVPRVFVQLRNGPAPTGQNRPTVVKGVAPGTQTLRARDSATVQSGPVMVNPQPYTPASGQRVIPSGPAPQHNVAVPQSGPQSGGYVHHAIPHVPRDEPGRAAPAHVHSSSGGGSSAPSHHVIQGGRAAAQSSHN